MVWTWTKSALLRALLVVASAMAGIMTWKGDGTSPDAARGQQLLALAESQGVDPTPLLEEAGLA